MMDEINNLKIQNFLFIVFAVISLMNVRGDILEENYLLSNNNFCKNKANNIFKFTIKTTILIYLYFLIRNIDAYNNISNDKKDLYLIKVYGSCFLIAGAICLLYFQEKENSFIGAPTP